MPLERGFSLNGMQRKEQKGGITWGQGVARFVFDIISDEGFIEGSGPGWGNLVRVTDEDVRMVNIGLDGLIALKDVP
jgi:hypothetical protein